MGLAFLGPWKTVCVALKVLEKALNFDLTNVYEPWFCDLDHYILLSIVYEKYFIHDRIRMFISRKVFPDTNFKFRHNWQLKTCPDYTRQITCNNLDLPCPTLFETLQK